MPSVQKIFNTPEKIQYLKYSNFSTKEKYITNSNDVFDKIIIVPSEHLQIHATSLVLVILVSPLFVRYNTSPRGY